MKSLFFGGRHGYPGETVSWSELFGEWMAHPVLAGLMVLCVIWMFARLYAVWKYQKAEREELERQRERWGDTPETEAEKPEPPRPKRTGDIPFGERNRPVTRYEWRLFPLLFVAGFMIGMGGGVASVSDFLLLLFVILLSAVLFVAKNMPADWMKTTSEEDRKQKWSINRKDVAKGLIPYGLAVLAGLAFGLVQSWLIGR